MQTADVTTPGRLGAFRVALAAELVFWLVIVMFYIASSADSGGADAAANVKLRNEPAANERRAM